MKSNTFNRPKEKVEMIHEAIESPGKHSAYLKSFGLINYEEIKNQTDSPPKKMVFKSEKKKLDKFLTSVLLEEKAQLSQSVRVK